MVRVDVLRSESEAEDSGSEDGESGANSPQARTFYAHLPCIFLSIQIFKVEHGPVRFQVTELDYLRLITPNADPCPTCNEGRGKILACESCNDQHVGQGCLFDMRQEQADAHGSSQDV